MAKAIPVSSGEAGEPAPAEEVFPVPVGQEPVVTEEVVALVAEAEAAGKKAVVIGNAVRVDN